MLLAAALFLVLWASSAPAAPVRMRYPEGPSHGFVRLLDEGGNPLAHGEVVQWLESRVVASRLVFRFDDGSVYDEVVRFHQHPFFRVSSYRLIHHGPSFAESVDVSFDQSGQYSVRRRATPDAKEETAEGHVDVPDDVGNGMISTLLKNLPPGGTATTHILAFRPKPMVLETRLTPEGTDPFVLGPMTLSATRFAIEPKVRGVTGVLASALGKQPSPLYMWIAQGIAPTLVHFEGSLYTDGPSWRIELTGPKPER